MASFFRRKAEKKKTDETTRGLSRSASLRSNTSVSSTPDTTNHWKNDNGIGVGSTAHQGRPGTLCLSETVLEGQDVLDESLASPMRTSSRLSKTLLEIVRDKDALSCLKAFLKTQKADQLIQFWCEAESFHATTLTRQRTHSLHFASKCSNHKKRSDSLRTDKQTTSSSSTSAATSTDKALDNCDNQTSSTSPSLQGLEDIKNKGKNTKSSNGETISSSVNQNSETIQVVSPTGNQCESAKSDVIVNCDNSVPSDIRTSEGPQTSNILQNEITSISQTNAELTSQSNLSPSLKTKSENHQASQSSDKVSSHDSTTEATGSDVSSSSGEVIGSVGATSSQEDISIKLKKSIERDAFTIFSAYIAKDATSPIGVDDDFRSDAISKICREDGDVDPECFVSCQRFALDRIDNLYMQAFRDSEHHCRHQANVLTSQVVYLPDILLNDHALCYFTEYMEQEGGSDLIQLWLAVDNFQQQLSKNFTSGDRKSGPANDWEQDQNDAMVIYDRYFSLQASHPVGFDDCIRFEVEGNICRDGGPLPDCFTKAKNIVLKILEKMYFPSYLQSQVYHRYLSDLVSTVEMAEDLHTKPFHRTHRRTVSDASSITSEHSIGSHSTGNTLLAVDTRKGKGQGSTPVVTPISTPGDFTLTLEMDMVNPDNLWKRPAAGDMSLGSVNALGQFVSQFELDADVEKKKSSGFFKRRKEKEKEQEAMALKVAQMIISDVNTMTKTGENMATMALHDEDS